MDTANIAKAGISKKKLEELCDEAFNAGVNGFKFVSHHVQSMSSAYLTSTAFNASIGTLYLVRTRRSMHNTSALSFSGAAVVVNLGNAGDGQNNWGHNLYLIKATSTRITIYGDYTQTFWVWRAVAA